jgi:hypothetical protein
MRDDNTRHGFEKIRLARRGVREKRRAAPGGIAENTALSRIVAPMRRGASVAAPRVANRHARDQTAFKGHGPHGRRFRARARNQGKRDGHDLKTSNEKATSRHSREKEMERARQEGISIKRVTELWYAAPRNDEALASERIPQFRNAVCIVTLFIRGADAGCGSIFRNR